MRLIYVYKRINTYIRNSGISRKVKIYVDLVGQEFVFYQECKPRGHTLRRDHLRHISKDELLQYDYLELTPLLNDTVKLLNVDEPVVVVNDYHDDFESDPEWEEYYESEENESSYGNPIEFENEIGVEEETSDNCKAA